MKDNTATIQTLELQYAVIKIVYTNIMIFLTIKFQYKKEKGEI